MIGRGVEQRGLSTPIYVVYKYGGLPLLQKTPSIPVQENITLSLPSDFRNPKYPYLLFQSRRLRCDIMFLRHSSQIRGEAPYSSHCFCSIVHRKQIKPARALKSNGTRIRRRYLSRQLSRCNGLEILQVYPHLEDRNVVIQR